MRGWIVCFALAACLATGVEALARQDDGFAGTPFGTSLAALPSFLTLKTDGDVTYAVNLSESYRLDGKAPVVIYGFGPAGLFAAYVRLDGLVGRDVMVKRLTAQFGKPATTAEDGGEVLRWRKGKLKVKLKSNPSAGSLKLGYYAATGSGRSARLPELDSQAMDGLVKLYEKEKIAKGLVLPPAPAPKGYSPYDDGVAAPSGRSPSL